MYYSMKEVPLVMNAAQVAKVLGISRSLSYQIFRRGDFPAVCLGRRKVVSREAFIRWFEAQQNVGGENNGENAAS